MRSAYVFCLGSLDLGPNCEQTHRIHFRSCIRLSIGLVLALSFVPDWI